ncbi:ubx domain-containing protein 4 [Limosa lapponica baueri]|uniref:Ubx domain-containing protein 4 n=1 Tax=Limosa lapponica baueri TaxID=1758121 RepID=A0A2I0USV9_LIMLA|nr:ubx domain-containing protein 4 [Limosa lapponica baueri]
MVKTMVRQAVPLKPMEVNSGADIHLEDPTWVQADAPKGGCDPMGTCTGAGSWQDLWTCGENSPRWSRFVGRACDPWGTNTGAVGS